MESHDEHFRFGQRAAYPSHGVNSADGQQIYTQDD
jgi:hypothetical protein